LRVPNGFVRSGAEWLPLIRRILSMVSWLKDTAKPVAGTSKETTDTRSRRIVDGLSMDR
jgi:hypothetical protein